MSLLDSLRLIPSQLKASVPKVGLATGLAGSRLGVGALQGVSGLYDLATPGIGTNRLSKGLNNTAKNIDATAIANDVNPAYRIMQAALTPASFYVPGAAVSKVTKGAGVLNKTLPLLDNGQAVSRISNAAIQGFKPLNTVNSAVNMAGNFGQMSGKGQDINPVNGSLIAALNLAAPLALPAAGQGAIEAGRAALPASKVAAKGASQALNVKPHLNLSDSEVLAAAKMQAIRQGQADGMDVSPQEAAHYQSFLSKTKLNPNDANGHIQVIKARTNYDNTHIRRQGQATEALKTIKQAMAGML